MEQKKIDRINELARKSKTEGLTEAEQMEQKLLRAEYIEAYRQNLRSQLDAIVVKDENGKLRKLKKRS